MKLLKRMTALLLFSAIVFGLVGGVPGLFTVTANKDADGNEIVNLLDGNNASFEEYSIPNWTCSENVSQSDEYTYADSAWSMKIADFSKKESYWAEHDKLEIEAGEKYVLSAQVYGGIGELSASFYNANGKELTDKKIVVSSKKETKKWTLISKDFTAPQGVSYVIVKVSSTVSGNKPVYFDSISLGVEPLAPFVPSIENANFDAAWTGSVAPGWTRQGAAATSYQRVPNGDGYAMSVTKASGAGYTFTSNRIPVRGGLAYTFSIDIKLATSTGWLQLYMYFYEDATTKTKLATAYNPANGDYSSEWATAAVNGIAPENAQYMEILITDPRYSDGAALFDNACLRVEDGVFNPSFEEAVTSAASFPVGWAMKDEKKGASLNRDAANVRTGKQSLSLERLLAPRSFYVNVKPGETYEASAYVKRQAGKNDENRVSLYLYFYKADGTRRNIKNVSVSAVNKEWTKITVKATAVDGEVAANFMITPEEGTGVWYVDDASFKKMTDHNFAKNLLTNGGVDDRKIENNTPIPHWTADKAYEAAHIAVQNMDAEHGNAARIYGATYVPMWSEPIAIKAGETYSLTMDCTGAGRVQAIIYYYANKNDAPKEYLVNETGTAICKFNTTANLKSGTWTQLAVSKSEAPANAKYARIWLIGMSDTVNKKLDCKMDDVCFFKGLPQIVIPGELGELPNASFEELDELGNPVDWGTVNSRVFSVVDGKNNKDAVYDGRYALMLTVPKEMEGTHGVRSGKIPIEAGVTYRLSLYAKESEAGGKPFQLYIEYFDKTETRVAAFFSTTTATGEWNYCEVSGAAPTNALYATVALVSGDGKGSATFDKLEFFREGEDAYAPVQFDGDWKIAEANHPRVYFNQEGLASIRRFASSKAVCAYGYAGTVTLKSLLKEADTFLAEKQMTINHWGIILTYPLYPKLEDPTCRPEFETSPSGMNRGFPYMTAVGENIRKRVETLALAYAITGDEKYGERAAQYTLDICKWKYWVGYVETLENNDNGELSSQCSGYLTDAVAMGYDMCYDLFTVAERKQICNATIKKGLEPMLNDCWPRMLRGRDMDHATCMLSAACAIMTEDNMDELKKFMDMGMSYINWRLDQFMYSGINEGHSYDSLAIDDIVVTMDIVERCTGYSGPWSHPFIEELPEIVLGFFDPVNGILPNYSDCSYDSYYPYSMAIFSQHGNELATYYLSMSDALATTFDKLVYFTTETLDTLEAPFDNVENVGYVASKGFGALRTGFGVLDSMLVINANNSQQEHNHYDQNSLQLAFNGSWVLTDTGYKDQSYSDLTTYQMKYANSTIFVDGNPQCRKGQGSLELVFDNTLYGYLIGSAPGAYGMEDKQDVLNKFDRHTIMINHDSQPYYLIIDDLESNKARKFGWNFYTNGWDRYEIDGAMVEDGKTGSGNRLSLSRFGSTLHSYFVGNEPLTSKENYFKGYGPTLLMESKPSTKYQFMNVISLQKGSGSQVGTLFEHMMKAPSSTELVNNVEGEINWMTNKGDISTNAVLSVSIGGPLVMFRAGKVGDWITFPFEVAETREYGVTIEVGRSTGYSGTWSIYVDDKKVETYEPNGPIGVLTIDAGKMKLEAGTHIVKAVLDSTPESIFNGTIMSVGSITLDTGESIGEGIVKVTETYDNKSVLGAEISYGTVLSDVVLFNRGKGSVSAGKLTTDGQQASVLGLYNDTINEGYAATKATSLKYGDLTLMTADGKVSVAVDYSFAKMPIKNTDDEKEIVLHEDFDIDKPVIKVSTSAEKARKVTILVGTDYPYVATINGETIESTYDNGMLTFTVPAGTHNVEIAGHHNCIFDRKVIHIQNVKNWATCTEGVEYYVSCVCGENGTESFFSGEAKGHKLVAIEAKEPTETENGNIACWQCKTCKAYFADTEGKEELKESDVILLSFEKERQNLTIMIVLIVVGVLLVAGVATLLILRFKFGFFVKKKPEEEASVKAMEENPTEEINE